MPKKVLYYWEGLLAGDPQIAALLILCERSGWLDRSSLERVVERRIEQLRFIPKLIRAYVIFTLIAIVCLGLGTACYVKNGELFLALLFCAIAGLSLYFLTKWIRTERKMSGYHRYESQIDFFERVAKSFSKLADRFKGIHNPEALSTSIVTVARDIAAARLDNEKEGCRINEHGVVTDVQEIECYEMMSAALDLITYLDLMDPRKIAVMATHREYPPVFLWQQRREMAQRDLFDIPERAHAG